MLHLNKFWYGQWLYCLLAQRTNLAWDTNLRKKYAVLVAGTTLFYLLATLFILRHTERVDVVGWIRNLERKTWSFSIPYDLAGKVTPMFPDFLVIRREGEGNIVDILEPHRGDLDDNWRKAVGLAKFADLHWNSFGRIQLIRMVGHRLKRLNLNDDVIRQRILGVTSNETLNILFDALAI